jgi:hypothetical protein
MSRVLLRVGFVGVLTILPAFGAEVNRSWETLVETLKPGRKVVVVQHSRKQAEGKVLSLTNESITVQVGRQPLTVQRDDVFRVRVANIRRRNTLIGLALGAAVAGGLGYTLEDFYRGFAATVGAGVGAGIGAAAGGVIPIGKPLYEAPGGLKRARP